MISYEGNKCVFLKDKREIYLNDEDYPISFSIVSNGKPLFDFPFSDPSSGYGGGHIFLSPSESYLIFLYYSGQHEEAFTLFEIGNKLELFYESDYLIGAGATYSFSKDEKIFIQFLPDSHDGWCGREPEEDEEGKQFYSFGYINTLDMEKKEFLQHKVLIYPIGDWQAEQYWEPNKIYEPLSPELTDDILTISMPWGNERIKFPLEDKIVFKRNFDG
jgi:hypothetical protein